MDALLKILIFVNKSNRFVEITLIKAVLILFKPFVHLIPVMKGAITITVVDLKTIAALILISALKVTQIALLLTQFSVNVKENLVDPLLDVLDPSFAEMATVELNTTQIVLKNHHAPIAIHAVEILALNNNLIVVMMKQELSPPTLTPYLTNVITMSTIAPRDASIKMKPFVKNY